MAPTNHTGFSAARLAAASGRPANDPWAQRELWRRTGPFTRWNRFKGAFPGLGIATVAFTVYCVAEAVLSKDEHHDDGHGDGHGEKQ